MIPYYIGQRVKILPEFLENTELELDTVYEVRGIVTYDDAQPTKMFLKGQPHAIYQPCWFEVAYPEYTANPTVMSFCYPMSTDDFLFIHDHESYVNKDPNKWDQFLSKVLERESQASSVDYNGHFGANIFYSLDVEDNTPEEHQKIKKIIDDHLQMLKDRVAET